MPIWWESITMSFACAGTKNAIGTAVNTIQSEYSAEELAQMSPEEQEQLGQDIAKDIVESLEEKTSEMAD